MRPGRIPKQAQMFTQKGRSDLGRPRKRCEGEAGTGKKPNP